MRGAATVLSATTILHISIIRLPLLPRVRALIPGILASKSEVAATRGHRIGVLLFVEEARLPLKANRLILILSARHCLFVVVDLS